MAKRTTNIHDLLMDNIKDFFATLDDSDPIVVHVIGSALIGYERAARMIHDMHSRGRSSFSICTNSICSENNRQLQRLYRQIIDMRKQPKVDLEAG